LRILILNWRDLRNPRAGGAEVLTHEVARRLVERGHDVTWFTSRPAGLPPSEEADGVRVLREGSEVSTRLHAARFARKPRFDVVVEEINTLPYFSATWSRVPTILFIPQLARHVWWYEAPRLLAPLGYAVEPLYLSAYSRVEAVTISTSTRDDLRKVGLTEPIHIIPMASSTPALHRLPPKVAKGGLVFVGRLVKSKRIDHAIRSLAFLRLTVPDATLTVVGDGPELPRARELVARLGIQSAVRFAGRVTERVKNQVMRDADILIACSVREGWGLTVTEAARMGTPSVAYDVPGLRDSITDGRTGLLTAPSPEALAEAVHGLLHDTGGFERLRRAAWREASRLSWGRTADAFERALASVTGNRDGSRESSN
jgi:glycosyltransferase involved in cell wall biosynthesis